MQNELWHRRQGADKALASLSLAAKASVEFSHELADCERGREQEHDLNATLQAQLDKLPTTAHLSPARRAAAAAPAAKPAAAVAPTRWFECTRLLYPWPTSWRVAKASVASSSSASRVARGAGGEKIVVMATGDSEWEEE